MGEGWGVIQDWPKKTFCVGDQGIRNQKVFINVLSGPLHSKVFSCGGRHQPPLFTLKLAASIFCRGFFYKSHCTGHNARIFLTCRLSGLHNINLIVKGLNTGVIS